MDDLVALLCADIQRLAVDGIAPSMSRYDQQRDRALPASWRITRATGLYWDEIVELAGLRLSAAVRRSMIKTPASRPPSSATLPKRCRAIVRWTEFRRAGWLWWNRPAACANSTCGSATARCVASCRRV